MIKLVIFDLDGTLLNTIADLAASTNHALELLAYPTHEVEKYNFMVGNGINKLFERALPEGEKSEENIQKMREIFVQHYSKHLTDRSLPYEGILELLETLQSQGVKLAVATNKYQEGAETLVKHFFASFSISPILGQREGYPTKPDPLIIEEILEVYSVQKSEVLYVGDSDVDMLTAKNAGVIGCGVSWGFRPIEELEAHEPDYIVHHPHEIVDIVNTLK